ncbi:acyltransferase [Ravibacter arvi]|uniref:Acyltransferase n=1 Tax=Ravibacter arvi TaxID=2051041 RepID=A0ABP8MAP7_9BACT
MTLSKKIEQLFSRNIQTGKLIPELDGLRFLAIFLVFLHHVHAFFEFSAPVEFKDIDRFEGLRLWLIDSRKGVDLFFVISGFILALPFARSYLKGSPVPSLKKYFRRRLTRLEPPYMVAMIGMFFIFPVFTEMDYLFAFKSLLASLVYSHVFFYEVSSFLLPVAWSLELEVHFYLLAPLLFLVLKLPAFWRRTGIVAVILLLPWIQVRYQTPGFYLIHYIQFFISGILLADFYMNWPGKKNTSLLQSLAGAVLFAVVLFLPHVRTHLMQTETEIICAMIFPLAIAGFYYIVLTNVFWGRLFAFRWISLIGGMCYSIYLVHQPILSATMKILFKFQFFSSYAAEFLIVALICTVPVMLGSIVFFLLIEKPCMDPEWPEKLWAKLKSAFKKWSFF